MRVTKDGANLRGGETLLGKLTDELGGLLTAGLEPARGTATVRDGGARDALTIMINVPDG